MNGIHRLGLYLMTALLIAALAVPVVAQDATAEPTGDLGGTPIVCESSLILLVGLAQRAFGFQPSVDLNRFERGQYGSLFEGQQGDMGAATGSATGEETPVAEPGTGSGQGDTGGDEGEATASATSEETPVAGAETGGGVMLQPPVIAGELVECLELRAEVEQFFMGLIERGELGSSATGTASQGG